MHTHVQQISKVAWSITMIRWAAMLQENPVQVKILLKGMG